MWQRCSTSLPRQSYHTADVYRINTWYTLNLHDVICQIYLTKKFPHAVKKSQANKSQGSSESIYLIRVDAAVLDGGMGTCVGWSTRWFQQWKESPEERERQEDQENQVDPESMRRSHSSLLKVPGMRKWWEALPKVPTPSSCQRAQFYLDHVQLPALSPEPQIRDGHLSTFAKLTPGPASDFNPASKLRMKAENWLFALPQPPCLLTLFTYFQHKSQTCHSVEWVTEAGPCHIWAKGELSSSHKCGHTHLSPSSSTLVTRQGGSCESCFTQHQGPNHNPGKHRCQDYSPVSWIPASLPIYPAPRRPAGWHCSRWFTITVLSAHTLMHMHTCAHTHTHSPGMPFYLEGSRCLGASWLCHQPIHPELNGNKLDHKRPG